MDPHERYLTLLLQHETDVRGFICALVSDAQERDDVFQETALVLWRRFSDFDEGRSFGGWARGIAAKVVLAKRSRSERYPAPLPNETIAALLGAFERTESQANERVTALRKCLEGVPERTREVLSLRYGDNLKGAEIAARLRLKVEAVHQILSRVRVSLEECIRRRLAGVGLEGSRR
jgi:RNA polymerase sigma-70 factor (ECF subfamily)